MKYKIIHLHTDIKFILGSKIYYSDLFDNIIYFINTSGNKDIVPKYCIGVELTKKNINKILSACKNADLVVLWGLSLINQRIALALDNNVKIAWRLFGYELYGKIPNLIYTKATIKAIDNCFKSALKQIPLIQKALKYKNLKNNQNFYASIKRINYLIGLSEEEYYFLKKHFSVLPPFIKLPVSAPKNSFTFKKTKPSKIVLGHNGHSLNNHLDILQIIKKSPQGSKYNYYILMNYGGNNRYGDIVKKTVLKMPEVHIIEKFMPYDEFEEFYTNISAFVLNAHRECGVGNIFTGLHSGVKIYLNKKNIVLDWLRNEGFILYTIEDFIEDLKFNNLVLNEKEALHNYNNLLKYAERNSVKNFQQKIVEILKKN